MRKLIGILFLSMMVVGAVFSQAPGQPDRGFLGDPFCETLVDGSTRQVFSIQLYEVGKQFAVQQFYVDSTGAQVTVNGMVRAGLCNQNITLSNTIKLDTTIYESHLHVFNNNDTVPTINVTLPTLTNFREAIIFNYTSAILSVKLNVEGASNQKEIFIPPLGSINLPNPKNGEWNQGKFNSIQIDGVSNYKNVGAHNPPHIIVDVKDY